MMKKSFYIGISFLITFTLCVCLIVKADNIDEIQAKINTANKNRAALEKEIATYQNQLKLVSDQAATLKNTIKSLDISTNKITTEVKLTENNIGETTYSIEDTGLQIQDKEKQINKDSMAVIESLRQINESDSRSVMEVILSNQDLSDFWNDIEGIIQVQAKIGDQIAAVKNIKASLEKAKADLEKKKKELLDYTNELSARKQVLQSTKKQKNSLLSVTKNTEANYQKILKDKLALKTALDQEISSAESELRQAIDPKNIPPAGKGVLAWPLDSVFITQNFGRTSDSGRLYVSGTHNGVDFRATIGTPVKSAGNGVVEGVGDTDAVCAGASYGKWVFIRYDNGLASIYGHFSLISTKPGQKVKKGDVVGYSGYSGYVDPQGPRGAHLHMSVYAGEGVKISTFKSTVCKGTYTMPMLTKTGAYLDPLIYL